MDEQKILRHAQKLEMIRHIQRINKKHMASEFIRPYPGKASPKFQLNKSTKHYLFLDQFNKLLQQNFQKQSQAKKAEESRKSVQ